jgi:predicted transglutaminase-like cysteine proteinase
MNIKVMARAVARLLPLAFAIAVPSLVLAAPEGHAASAVEHPAGAPASQSLSVKLAAFPRGMTSIRPEPFTLGSSTPGFDVAKDKWLQVRNELARDVIVLAGCRSAPEACPAAARQLLDLIDGARGKQGRALLGEINRSINLAIRYVTDVKQHGSDVWSSPLATFASGRGDCEDYAIAKYLALRESGIAAENLRIVIVQTRRGSEHAVLAAWLDDHWLLLDNAGFVLVQDHDRTDYRAIVALGTEGLAPAKNPHFAESTPSQSTRSSLSTALLP